jgi:SAGA-associated factor 73
VIPRLKLYIGDDDTIKVASKKEGKDKAGTIKLKKPAPKHKLPGNWRDGSVIDGM